MAEKRTLSEELAKKALEAYLRSKDDVANVHQVEQKLKLHVLGTEAYIPSYTRQVMQQNHGAPFTAVVTRTDREDKMVFITPAKDSTDANARVLRNSPTGPGYFAFGVPLRELGVVLPDDAPMILTMHPLEVPEKGIVYFVTFAEIEKKARKAAVKAAAAPKAQAKKGAKGKKAAGGEGLEQG